MLWREEMFAAKQKTGSGKTLAFSLPSVAHTELSADGKPSTLILTPTRELANQITGVVGAISYLSENFGP